MKIVIRFPSRRVGCGLAAAALALLAACDGSTDPRLDARACRQTGEFGNSGCADIEGVIVNASGLGVAGITVGARFVYAPITPGAGGATLYGGEQDKTDQAGRFRIRITRYSGESPAAGPDTVSLFVYAVDARRVGDGTPPTVRDSVATRVTLSPVGEAPKTTLVTIRLPLP